MAQTDLPYLSMLIMLLDRRQLSPNLVSDNNCITWVLSGWRSWRSGAFINGVCVIVVAVWRAHDLSSLECIQHM